MAFYLKYRPQTLSDLDSTYVKESLQKILAHSDIPHAFLFSGPKGTGKTSTARIVAKIVNCERLGKREEERGKRKEKYTTTNNQPLTTNIEPCNECDSCKSITHGTNIDVIEIDAASHRGIDDVRAIRDAAKLSTFSGAKKIYIIDEAHMLTTEASNALLKILEEPPAHVMFILATTNPEKLLDTIRSRALTINFKRAQPEELVASLEKIARAEKLTFDKAGLLLIAESADGSFRDGAKLLEQVASNDLPVSEEHVLKLLHISSGSRVSKLLEFLTKRDIVGALGEIQALAESGEDISYVVSELIKLLRNDLLVLAGFPGTAASILNKAEVLKLLELLMDTQIKLPTSFIESLPFEIAVVRWCEDQNQKSNIKIKKEKENRPDEILKKKTESVARIVKNEGKEEIKDDEVRVEDEDLDINLDTHEVTDTSSKEISEAVQSNFSGNQLDDTLWGEILKTVKPLNTSTEALLRAAKPLAFDGAKLTIGVYYSFHKERLEQIVHRKLVEDVCSNVLGNRIQITCELTEPEKKIVSESVAPIGIGGVLLTENKDDDIIKIAEEIFGN